LKRVFFEKKQIYAKSGIEEYWIADLKHRRLIVFRNPTGSDYLYQTELPSGTLFPSAFPDVQLEIDRFFQ
jgi:Uma2 family endonuclease